MTSRRKTILAAMVTEFEKITVANGYNSNVGAAAGGGGAQKVASPENSLATLPTLVISIPGEEKIAARHSHYEPRLNFSIFAFAAEDGSTPIEDELEDLIEDVEKVALLQAEASPGWGVAGVQDTVLLGHDKFSGEADEVIWAEVRGYVLYRHNLTDPGAFT